MSKHVYHDIWVGRCALLIMTYEIAASIATPAICLIASIVDHHLSMSIWNKSDK